MADLETRPTVFFGLYSLGKSGKGPDWFDKDLTLDENHGLGVRLVGIRQRIEERALEKGIDLEEMVRQRRISDRQLQIETNGLKGDAEKLALGNLGLVAFGVNRSFKGFPLSPSNWDDYRQEGTINGLLYAAVNYDPVLGEFSTYAVECIKGAVLKARSGVEGPIKLTVHLWDELDRYRKIQKGLVQYLGERPSHFDVMLIMFLKKKLRRFPTEPEIIEQRSKLDREGRDFDRKGYWQFWRYSKKMGHVLNISEMGSTDEPRRVTCLNPKGDLESFEVEVGENIPDAGELLESGLARALLKKEIEEAMEVLSERERQVIELKFGLEDGVDRTLAETGNILRVSPTRVRQIQRKALKKLQRPARSRRLRDYLGE